MKIISRYFIVLIFISLTVSIFPQTGKPQYNLRCERAGNYIGDIKVELFPLIAPLHTHNFDSLVSIQFFDTTAFHRVVPNFVIQGGDPNSRHGDPSTWGFGDSTQTNVPAEFSNVNHARGILGAARDVDINSANSQFFINVVENSGLNGLYTVYGRVYEGMNIADNIVNSPTVPGTERPVEKIEMFVTYIGMNNSVPATPVLISPANGLVDVVNALNFQWSADNESVLFRFQISEDSTFTNTQLDTLIGVRSSLRGNFEQGLKKFYWRVQANNGGNLSDFSETRNFTTGIAAPILTTPPDSAINVSVNPDFAWQTVDGAETYRIQIATTGSFVGAGLIINTTGLTDTTFSATNLQLNKKYFWRVRGITPSYEGTYSKVRTFTTTATVDVTDKNQNHEYELLQNYPNPFNPSTEITFSIMNREHVTLKVYDVLGREIITLVNENLDAGVHKVKLELNNILIASSSGVYFYKLTAGSFVETKKMLLIK